MGDTQYHPLYRDHQFSFGDQYIAAWERSPQSQPKRHFVFLHGRFGSSDTWMGLVRQLPRAYRCLCPDLPGFGRSFSVSGIHHTLYDHVVLIEKIIKRLAGASVPVVLVGHDIGAVIAKMVVVRKITPIEAMILLSPASLLGDGEDLKPGFWGWRARRKLKSLFESDFHLSQSYQDLLEEPWERKGSRDGLIEAFQAFWQSWPDHYQRKYWKEELRKVHAPTLVLRGGLDELNSREPSLDLARTLQEASYYEEPNSGHWVHLTNPEWVAFKMEEFVFQLDEPVRNLG